MTGDDQGNRILPERLSDLAREQFIAKPFCDLSVGQCRTRRDRACDDVNLAIELRQTVDIDRHVVQIAFLAAQKCDNAIDGLLHMSRGLCFLRTGKTSQETRPRRRFRPVVNLHARDAARIPDNSARTDRGVEYRETVAHFRNDSTRRQAAPPDSRSAFMAMRSDFGMGFARPPETKATWT